jgi:hypothetical protein
MTISLPEGKIYLGIDCCALIASLDPFFAARFIQYGSFTCTSVLKCETLLNLFETISFLLL